VFLALFSVCMSVCPSHFHVRSISFEPLVGFTNNSAEVSSMRSRCAVCMFDQGWFKVKHCMTVLRFLSVTLEELVIF